MKAATGAPVTTQWKQGAQVKGNTNLPTGTAIATFENGHYHGHAALYVSQNKDGITVIDQYNRNPKTNRPAQPPSLRVLTFGTPKKEDVDQGEKYYVITK